jgi:osomolarity two-component system, sensor histidine kinase SLN1
VNANRVVHRSSSAASSIVKYQLAAAEPTESESQRNSVVITSTAAIPPPGDNLPAHSLNPNPRLVGLSQPYFSVDMPEAKTTEVKVAGVVEKDQLKPRVLVADDNSTNIEVVSRMLKLEDIYDVTIAKDGQEAYDVVKASMEKNEAFDVIFMDVQMPNVDGLQSTRLIRSMGYTSPIVALTAFSEESNVKECMDSGMNEFLSKPIRRPALKQVLQRFATIPEETETSTLTGKPSNEKRKSDEKSELRSNGDARLTTIPSHTEVPNGGTPGAPVIKAG